MSKQNYPPGIKRMDDYVGRTVYIRRDLETRGGEKFPAGTAVIVEHHHRGHLSIAKLNAPGPGGVGGRMRQVRRMDVLLEPPTAK